MDEKVALYFAPENEGDHLIGLPARDLTESEVADLKQREPWLYRDATTPSPVTGRPLYQTTKPSGKRAEIIADNKDAATVNPTVTAAEPTETPVAAEKPGKDS